MRPPDAVLVFADSALLISEWEADHILPLQWKRRDGLPLPFMANLAYITEAADLGWPADRIRLRVPADTVQVGTRALDELTVAGLQLLAGETMFATDARKRSIETLVAASAASRKAALRLVALRGRHHMIARSHLEGICNVDIGEAS